MNEKNKNVTLHSLKCFTTALDGHTYVKIKCYATTTRDQKKKIRQKIIWIMNGCPVNFPIISCLWTQPGIHEIYARFERVKLHRGSSHAWTLPRIYSICHFQRTSHIIIRGRLRYTPSKYFFIYSGCCSWWLMMKNETYTMKVTVTWWIQKYVEMLFWGDFLKTCQIMCSHNKLPNCDVCPLGHNVKRCKALRNI